VNKMKTVCKKCGSDDIHQQATLMINPNNIEKGLDLDHVIWDDYYWCGVCEDECEAKEISFSGQGTGAV